MIPKRILLKLSGEALQGNKDFGYCSGSIAGIVNEIKKIKNLGIQLAIVIGGGNIVRGKNLYGHGIQPATADYMGMLSTIMNALYLQDVIVDAGMDVRVMTSIATNEVAEPFIRLRAIKHLNHSRIVILAAGTGNPFSTTDTAAALKARELDCDLIIKATNVDGVYNKDPKKYPDAEKYEKITFDQALSEQLGVMDLTAFTMCKDSNIPIVVCDVFKENSLFDICNDISVGTKITGEIK